MRSLLAVAVVAGCALPDDVTETTAFVASDCPNFMCGSNSPEVDHLGLHDGNVNGLPNANGFRLVKVERAGRAWQMQVAGAEVRLTNGNEAISDVGVKDTVMHFVHEPSGVEYDIRIAEVLKTGSWARDHGDGFPVRTYLLEWALSDVPPASKVWKNICSNPGAENTGDMNKYHSIIFEGDRIDPATKTVKDVDPTWFNIGCAGHALAKLHLTGHTQAAIPYGFRTTLAERTTMLKMLSADYCGTGKNFTVAGVRLDWKDDKQWMALDTQFALVEARWTAAGAACLNTPRIVANPTSLSEATFDFESASDFRRQIEQACGRAIPKCNTTLERYHLISANP
jgi:hypothetical protein